MAEAGEGALTGINYLLYPSPATKYMICYSHTTVTMHLALYGRLVRALIGEVAAEADDNTDDGTGDNPLGDIEAAKDHIRHDGSDPDDQYCSEETRETILELW